MLAVGKTQPYTLRFSPKSVIPLERREEREHCFSNAQRGIPLSLPTPVPRWGVVGIRKTTRTLYILSMQGHLTLHVRRLVHISQVSGVFLKSQC